MHDGGTLDLDSLIAIARSERSGEIAPATAARLAQFQAAFDAAAEPAGAPAVCFAFHASVPQAEAAVKYRDVAIDHSKFDYDRIVRHCIAAALAAQPGARFILATDSQFLSDIEHPSLTIVRLPLDQASPMYERVIAMCAFVRSRQFNAPTAFLDSDAFLNAPIANLFQGHFDIGATYRPDPGLMPINEGVIFANSRNKDLVRAFFAGYLGTYDRLCGNAAVTGYYGNIKRWRGGQLSLNALTCPQGVPSTLDSAKAFGARIRYYPCSTFNFSIEMDRPYTRPSAGHPRGAAPEGSAQGDPGSDHRLSGPALAADRAALCQAQAGRAAKAGRATQADRASGAGTRACCTRACCGRAQGARAGPGRAKAAGASQASLAGRDRAAAPARSGVEPGAQPAAL